jgi:hypothetical protein
MLYVPLIISFALSEQDSGSAAGLENAFIDMIEKPSRRNQTQPEAHSRNIAGLAASVLP